MGNTYALERELGGGGMSRVFIATETALDRPVVLKVLPPELAQTLSTDRFRQEIRLAARLQHLHIVPLLSAGEAAGLLYYTMPFVEGESLRARLGREGELPVRDAVRLLSEVAEALAYAHEHGVVHRDIKPDNVLLSRGHALVADFGVAKALSAAATGESEGLTSLGVALGTPAYMAPEQASADPHIDHRADLYAWGCLAYECLTGSPPFVGRSTPALLAAQATEAPESILRRRPSLPPGLAGLVMRCLEKRPADRPQTAAELVIELEGAVTPSGGTAPTLAVAAAPNTSIASTRSPRRWALVLAAAVLLAAVAAALLARRHIAVADSADSRRLAVLPFDNLGVPSDEYFADGMTDAVRGKLAGLQGMQVIARASSNQYRRSTKPLAEIGRELGVRYLLTGTVRWERNVGGTSRVQVSPELVELPAGTTAWQQPFDAAITDVFAVQAGVAQQVAQALGVALGAGERQRMAERPTENLAAYDAFLRGDQLLVSEGAVDLESARRAVVQYRQAVERDSTFALAWARLARAAALLYSDGDRADSIVRLAHTAVSRALVLAPNRAETHYAVAYIEFNMETTRPYAGIEALERARALAPTDTDILSLLGATVGLRGRSEEALARLAEAARLDPRSVLVARRYAGTLLDQKRFAEADSVASAGLALAPDNVELIAAVIQSRLSRGDTAGARAGLQEAARHLTTQQLILNLSSFVWLDDSLQAAALRLPTSDYEGDRVVQLTTRSTILWNAGRLDAARATSDSLIPLVERQVKAVPANWGLRSFLAILYANAHRRDDALRELQQARDIGKPDPGSVLYSYWVETHAAIDALTGHPAEAVAWLDTLLRLPRSVTRASLRLDPGNALLRGRPDFERLVSGKP
ncbi:MAG: protein kinase domain-containing protein [Gemmatimonadales bacterium]